MTAGAFVTGTDTGAGKTVASCALLHALSAHGISAMPMKPVAAGALERDGRWINADTEALLAAAGLPLRHAAEVTPVLLRAPLAPHIAARREAAAIDLAAILKAFHGLRDRAPFVLVEGVGGFRVPLDDVHDTADLARAMALPMVMVVGLRLGCLNHALLTAQAIESCGLRLAGWIANEIDPQMEAREENVEALVRRLPAPLMGRLPYREPVDALALSRRLDVSALLP